MRGVRVVRGAWWQVAAHMSAAVAAARQQAALRRPLMPPVVGVLPQVRVGVPVPVSMPPVMGVLPVMPQFNLMRPLQPGQYPTPHAVPQYNAYVYR
jgi:hypothetical protein